MFDIAEAQARLPKLVRTKQTLSLCQGNETVAFLVPRDRMEALLETMEIQTSVKPPFWERSNRKLDFVSVAAVCDACWLAARLD